MLELLHYRKHNEVNIESGSIYYTTPDNARFMPLMHEGFKNLEEKSAEIVSQNGGHILEVGFGLGISATKFINSNIASYTCVEINNTIYQYAQNWAVGKSNVTIINSSWQEAFSTLTTKYDGIYFDNLDADHSQFYTTAKLVLNTGSIIATNGAGIYLGTQNMNIDSNVPAPHLYDNTFTEAVYQNLLAKGFYKVYWQYYNGTDYVKDLN